MGLADIDLTTKSLPLCLKRLVCCENDLGNETYGPKTFFLETIQKTKCYFVQPTLPLKTLMQTKRTVALLLDSKFDHIVTVVDLLRLRSDLLYSFTLQWYDIINLKELRASPLTKP